MIDCWLRETVVNRLLRLIVLRGFSTSRWLSTFLIWCNLPWRFFLHWPRCVLTCVVVSPELDRGRRLWLIPLVHWVSGLLIYSRRLINHLLALVKQFQLGMRQSEAQSDYEITTTWDLSHLLIAQSFNLMGSRSRYSVSLAQLPSVIGSPGIYLTRAGKDGHETRAS